MNNDDELKVPTDLQLFINGDNLFADLSIINILPKNERQMFPNLLENMKNNKKPIFAPSSNEEALYTKFDEIDKTISSETNYQNKEDIKNNNQQTIDKIKLELKYFSS